MIFPLLLLTGSLFLNSTQATFDDMDDDDFSLFVNAHGDALDRYGESAAKGCLTGAIGGAPGGFQALCIGCATGAAGNVAQDIVFSEKADRALEQGRNK